MQLHSLLANLGYTEKQSDIFLLLYQYGAKPASTVAKMMGIERTNTYKMLKVMVNKGLIATSEKNAVKHFFVPDKNIINHLVQQQRQAIEKTENLIPLVEAELQQYDEQRISPLPKMRFFEGKSGMEKVFADMDDYVRSEGYIVIKFFASNTLESQSSTPTQLRDYSTTFFQKLKEKGVRIEAYLGNGILMLEQVMKTFDVSALDALPAGHAAVHVFVVGECLYIMIYKDVPFALKIQSRELADVMHFFFKQMG